MKQLLNNWASRYTPPLCPPPFHHPSDLSHHRHLRFSIHLVDVFHLSLLLFPSLPSPTTSSSFRFGDAFYHAFIARFAFGPVHVYRAGFRGKACNHPFVPLPFSSVDSDKTREFWTSKEPSDGVISRVPSIASRDASHFWFENTATAKQPYTIDAVYF